MLQKVFEHHIEFKTGQIIKQRRKIKNYFFKEYVENADLRIEQNNGHMNNAWKDFVPPLVNTVNSMRIILVKRKTVVLSNCCI